TFVDRVLPTPERSRASAIHTLLEPRSVIAGEHHQGPVLESQPSEGIENPAGGPIKLLHHIAVETARGGSPKLVGRVEGNVRRGVREIKEKGPVLGSLDEGNRFIGKVRRQ